MSDNVKQIHENYVHLKDLELKKIDALKIALYLPNCLFSLGPTLLKALKDSIEIVENEQGLFMELPLGTYGTFSTLLSVRVATGGEIKDSDYVYRDNTNGNDVYFENISDSHNLFHFIFLQPIYSAKEIVKFLSERGYTIASPQKIEEVVETNKESVEDKAFQKTDIGQWVQGHFGRYSKWVDCSSDAIAMQCRAGDVYESLLIHMYDVVLGKTLTIPENCGLGVFPSKEGFKTLAKYWRGELSNFDLRDHSTYGDNAGLYTENEKIYIRANKSNPGFEIGSKGGWIGYVSSTKPGLSKGDIKAIVKEALTFLETVDNSDYYSHSIYKIRCKWVTEILKEIEAAM